MSMTINAVVKTLYACGFYSRTRFIQFETRFVPTEVTITLMKIPGRFITGRFITGRFISECEKQLVALDAFEELATAIPQHQGMDELLTYFEHTYIRGRRLPGRGHSL